MNNVLIYALKSGIILAVFYLIYQAFFRRDTFFRLRRNLLLIGLGISFILPLLQYHLPFRGSPILITPYPADAFAVLNDAATPTIEVLNNPSGQSTRQASASVPPDKILLAIYLLGAVFCAVRLIFQIIKTLLLVRKSDCSVRHGIRIVRLKEDRLPFTMFNTVFYNPATIREKDFEKIFIHEKTHIEQKHFIDLLLVELFLMVQWFNPFMWLYANAIKENHEFLADDAVIAKYSDKPSYQILLVNQAVGTNTVCLANHFYSSIKNRIIMITKSKTPRHAQLKVLIMLPVICLVLFACAQSSEHRTSQNGQELKGQKYYQITGKVMDKETRKPIAGAVVLISGTDNGCIANDKGEFSIEVPDLKNELVFSYINHSEVLISVKNQRPKTVYLDSELKSKVKMEIPKRSQGLGRIMWKNDTTFTIKPAPRLSDEPLLVMGTIIDKNNKLSPSNCRVSVKGKDIETGIFPDGQFFIDVPDWDNKLVVAVNGQTIELDLNSTWDKESIMDKFIGHDKFLIIVLKPIELGDTGYSVVRSSL
ncbi:MAG: carboxypeptidase-like regulatory domain-containing protein [Bacteroidales bacterium]|nr:carboxypeptidase-like regulatory domain-containing protein [Bacteroidales bacterium]